MNGPSGRRPAADPVDEAFERLRRVCEAAHDPAAFEALAVVAQRIDAGASGARAFQTRILEAIANGVITLSPLGLVTTFNRSAERTLGIGSADVLGKPAVTLAAYVRKLPELLATFYKSGSVQLRAEIAARRADGSGLKLQIGLSPFETGDGDGVAIVLVDVTLQRELEDTNVAQRSKAMRIAESFSRYLAPHVVQSLIDDPESIKLGGERRLATMLFADVRGFTRIASTMPPERVVDLLNSYFEEAVTVVFAHDGLLDKFYGDGFMAVFGPPRVREDDASRALAAALALQDAVARLRSRLDYPLEISIGLATGEVVAGHFGSTKRMEYTVIGDAVNLASGLQGAAPSGAIYCDERTAVAGRATSPALRRVDVKLKGRGEPVTAFAVEIDSSV